MSFNTLGFATFFIIVYAAYLVLPHKWQNRLLLLASYIFYCSWDWRFLPLLLLSTIVNFYCGLGLDSLQDERKRRILFISNICFNLAILGFFKYFNFFTEGFRTMLWLIGFQANPLTLNIILPLGISFYTFQVMSYPIDIYWGRIKSTRNLPDFALFVAFFPLIISGPIERARNLLPQISVKRNITADKFYAGCWLIFWGLYKKLVIADNLAKLTGSVFGTYVSAIPAKLAFLATIAFVFQLYADFSGYSDMARGLARLMGFEIMLNFKTPFFSKNPSDLWQRWHISLTTWIKEYLYYPLGLAQFFGRQLNANVVILLTWAIMGFWHGPQSKYIIWGIYHGVIIIVYSRLRIYAPFVEIKNKAARKLITAFRMFVMFALFSVGLVFFAAGTAREAFAVITSMVANFSNPYHLGSVRSLYAVMMVLFLLPAALIEYFQYKSDDELVVFKWPGLVQGALYYILFYMIVMYGVFSVQKYYYFQF